MGSPLLEASSIGCRDLSPARKSFFGGVSGLGFGTDSGRADVLIGPVPAELLVNLVGASSIGAAAPAVVSTSCVGTDTSADVIALSFFADGFGDSAGLGLGEGSASFSGSEGTSFLGVSNLRGLGDLTSFSGSDGTSLLGVSNLRGLGDLTNFSGSDGVSAFGVSNLRRLAGFS